MSFDAAGYFANFLVLCVVVLPAYHFTSSTRLRQWLLSAVGIVLLYYVAPRFVLLYGVYWLAAAALQTVVARTRDGRWATPVLWLCLLILLAPMVTWKLYAPTFLPWLAWFGNSLIASIQSDLGWVDAHRELLLPVGLSFATFRAVDMVLQTYLGSLDQARIDDVLAYGLCPMLLPIGPIATMQEVDFSRRVTAEDVKMGILRITVGFAKVFLLASFLPSWGNIFQSYNRPGWQVLISTVLFVLYFYLNFAGYSDIAIGSGRLFGMRLPENFRWPLLRRSPQQFWGSWHASLSRFAQRYIFVAAGGYRRKRQSIALLATMMVIAWWHDLTLSWTLFGLYHGAGLVVHRWWAQHRPATLTAQTDTGWYKILSWFLLFSFVVLGFPIISVPVHDLPAFYLAMIK